MEENGNSVYFEHAVLQLRVNVTRVLHLEHMHLARIHLSVSINKIQSLKHSTVYTGFK